MSIKTATSSRRKGFPSVFLYALGFPNHFQDANNNATDPFGGFRCWGEDALTSYLNRSDVRAAIHIPTSVQPFAVQKSVSYGQIFLQSSHRVHIQHATRGYDERVHVHPHLILCNERQLQRPSLQRRFPSVFCMTSIRRGHHVQSFRGRVVFGQARRRTWTDCLLSRS